MSVLFNNPLPAGVAALLEERRRTGADRFDEKWEGVLHVAPSPSGEHADVLQQIAEQIGPAARKAGLRAVAGGVNVGDVEDYRIPDSAILRSSAGTYFETAALVVEVISPNDESYAKLPFYAEHGVEEVILVDPAQRTIRWLGLLGSRYEPLDVSGVIDLGPAQLELRIVWPDTRA